VVTRYIEVNDDGEPTKGTHAGREKPGRKPMARETSGRPVSSEAKRIILAHLAKGETIIPAARAAGRTRDGYEWMRRQDKDFAAQVDLIIARRKGAVHPCPDFPEFCEEYLGQPLFEHQLRWYDILSGREPRNLHPSMRWSPGDMSMLLFNVPPGFAKSTTLTVNYVVWRICRDPNVRVVVVSATEKMAKKFLYAIKQRLSNPAYANLQAKFGPSGGFHATAESWTATEIYLGGKDDGEKDPTVQAIGMGGQIYGARADLIVVDDAVLLKNAHQFEDQIDWLTQDVITRLPEEQPDAKLLVVGTRVASVDLYSHLRDSFRDENDMSVFTYFAQPAVLEYAEDPRDWVSLWPETVDRDGQVVPKWSGTALKSRRDKVRPATWAMVYQQFDTQVEGVFPEAAVRAAIQVSRRPGLLLPMAEREKGMQGLYVVCGMDPAAAGYTAAVALGVDRAGGRIYLLDCFNKADQTPAGIKALIQSWTLKYAANEWVIEQNAFQRFLVQDDEVRSFLFSRGVILRGHHTHRGNKNDPDFGVASMASLFDPQADGLPTLLLPNANSANVAVARLVEQLIVWTPNGKVVSAGQTDLVMALWFAVLRARKILFVGSTPQRNYAPNSFLSRGRADKERFSVNLDEYAQEIMSQQMGV
jgi:hypothetical protein